MYISILASISFLIVSIHGEIPLEMKNLMNERVDPCVDFYRYSCGNWLKKTPLQYSTTRVDSSTTVIDTHIDNAVQVIIQHKYPILHEFWESCMDTDMLIALDNKPLQYDINRIEQAHTKDELLMLAGEFARTGGSAFVKFTVGPDPINTKINTLHIHPVLTLPHRNYYDDDKIIDRYEKYIEQLMLLAKSDRKRKRYTDDVEYTFYSDTVIRIEQDLKRIQIEAHELIAAKTMKAASIAWPNLVEKYSYGMRLSMKPDLKIYGSFQYLERVEAMIRQVSLAELKAYIMFRMIHSRVQWLENQFDLNWYVLFRKILKRQVTRLSRERICRNRLREYLPDLIGHYFSLMTFDTKRQGKAFEMITLLQNAMRKRIDQWNWMVEREKKNKARDKVNKLTLLIGQPKIPRVYPSPLSRTDFPSNMYRLVSYSFDKEMSKVGRIRDPEEWTVSSMDINVHYIRDRNTIVLPVGVLQPPLFHGANVHPARNFGAICSMIGHELIHGVDAKGSSYDEEGNERPWWDLETSMAFKDAAKCFQDQYSSFSIGKEHVNGEVTLAENIADNGGLTFAWDAYREYITHDKGNIGDVENEDGDKIFFIAFAQTLCGRERYNPAWHNRSPAKARVNGALMNNMEFAKTFQCKYNTLMNPNNKCFLW